MNILHAQHIKTKTIGNMKRLLSLIFPLFLLSSCGNIETRNEATKAPLDTATAPIPGERERSTPPPSSSPPPNDNQRPIGDLLKIEKPLPNMDISSPLKVEGEARGQWYFEGDFPVVLEDRNGKILARGVAEAQGRWMTSDFVPFELTLTYDDAPDDERGYLVFQRSNASGLPEHDRSFRLPVLFPPK
jgi:hypothetical protein